MRRKVLLVESEQAYLRQVMPHRIWHYVLMLVTLLFASMSVWRAFDSWHGDTVILMAVPIISLYWLLQYQIIKSATYLADYGQEDVSEKSGGAISGRKIIFTKVFAILQHHQFFIIFISLALLGLSLVITGFLLFNSHVYAVNFASLDDRGILRYVGVVRTGFSPWRPDFPFSLSQRIFYTVIVSCALLILTFVNCLVSVSVGLWAKHLGRACVLRLLLVAVVFGVFIGFYALRSTPALTCFRSRMIPDNCNEILFQMRLIDSIQAASLAFIDGGTSLATGLHGCSSELPWFKWVGYQGRHLGVFVVACLSQLILSGFLLQRVDKSWNYSENRL